MYGKRIFVSLILLFLISGAFASATGLKTDRTALSIIAGAESHGMIYACDCEHEPGGGVAKRASLLRTLENQGPLLLLDAGGFAAGGIYDDYSEGRAADSVRTEAMILAMGMMKYDAVGIGDDDLQYGAKRLARLAHDAGLPLVSANCFFRGTKRRPADPYVIVEKPGVTIGITALCTTERLFPIDSDITIEDPVRSLRSFWEEMSSRTDFQIILSHLGQEEAASIIAAFPGCDLMVNGHRKGDRNPVTMIGSVPLMQFGFQGKSLSGIGVSWEGEKIRFEKGRWYDVVPELSDDPGISGFLAKSGERTYVNTYDLYIMSECVYGIEALRQFLTLVESDTSLQWNLWFIGNAESDSTLSSLHGDGEIEEEKWWIAVKELYPESWIRFLRERTASGAPAKEVAERLRFDLTKLGQWVDSGGASALRRQYFRSMRLSIDASPTLLVNNRPFGRNITRLNLARFHCATRKTGVPGCDSLPECSEDVDCRSAGKLGKCMESRCEFRDAVPFQFTVVVADSTIENPERKVISTTMELFPGASPQIVGMKTGRGRKLIERYRSEALPFYLFGREVALTHNFSAIRSGIVEVEGGYTFRKGIVPANCVLVRKKVPGSLALYIDPFFDQLPDILSVIQADSSFRERIAIEPVILADPASTRPGTEERFRQEEAFRWIALGEISADKKRRYLESYMLRPGSSYWQALLPEGFSHEELTKRGAGSGERLVKLWETMRELDIKDPVVFLIDNTETVVLNGERELRRVLSRLRSRSAHR